MGYWTKADTKRSPLMSKLYQLTKVNDIAIEALVNFMAD
jgi:hypothetical protein